MSKQQEFLKFWNYLTTEVAGNIVVPADVQAYIDALSEGSEKEKPAFTPNGERILRYLQEHPQTQMYKARDIGDDIGVSSKGVSGAMRKLVTDGYVEKVGKDPVIYTITEKGKSVVFEGEINEE